MLFHKNKDKDLSNIMKDIYSKDRLVRAVEFLLGIFIVALSYNIFLLPSNTVYGVGGIGVILKKIWNFDPSITIFISSMLLLIVSYFALGKAKTVRTIAGSILYPLFVAATSYYVKYFDLATLEPIVVVIIGAVTHGLGIGLIFKAGYTTGGTDILNDIVSKYGKVSIGKSMLFTDGLIILISLFVFDFPTFIYSVISLYIISVMTDKVILGISQSKTFYIITDNETTVKNFIMNNLNHGVTVIHGRGGYTGDNQKIIMCTLPTREYYVLKEGLREIDPQAFMIVLPASEVLGHGFSLPGTRFKIMIDHPHTIDYKK